MQTDTSQGATPRWFIDPEVGRQVPVSDFVVDLENCEDEPIHVPGSIQPHGLLLALDRERRVVIASANLDQWAPQPADRAIGATIEEVAGEDVARFVRDDGAVRAAHLGDRPLVDLHGVGVSMATYESSGLLVCEFEEESPAVGAHLSVTRTEAMAVQHAPSVVAAADAVAGAVRSLTGFDRVMFYRFDDDWNGEVIAEHRRPDLNPFLGLHYPATDIPAQARELYRRNWLRIIVDIGYTPVPLVPPRTPSGELLDLSDSTIRSVSPIHIEYLQNMGVTASMSISIVIGGELWGLIACHHYSGPYRPTPSVRASAEFLGRLASVRFAEIEQSEARSMRASRFDIVEDLRGALEHDVHRSVAEVLQENEGAVLKIADAGGAMIRLRSRDVLLGATPAPEVIERALEAWPGESRILELNGPDGPCVLEPDVAAGILGTSHSGDRDEFCLWFRPEQLRTITWGGDPYEKEVEAERSGTRLSPRRSFDKWRELVRGQPLPWTDTDRAAVGRFTTALGRAVAQRDRTVLQIATDLQTVMLPAELPQLAGVEIDAFYAPDGVGRVGGDWYDTIEVGNRVALVVGDVAGHGLAAAAAMAQCRNALRSYFVMNPSPGTVLGQLDAFVRATMPGQVLSVAMAVIDLDGHRVQLALSGHLPPLVVTDHGATYVEAPVNRLLGVHDGPFEEIGVDLQAGDRLVLYSDGLVERRDLDLDDRLDHLARVSAEIHGTTSSRWAEALDLQMTSGDRRDDVTVLMVRLTER